MLSVAVSAKVRMSSPKRGSGSKFDEFSLTKCYVVAEKLECSAPSVLVKMTKLKTYKIVQILDVGESRAGITNVSSGFVDVATPEKKKWKVRVRAFPKLTNKKREKSPRMLAAPSKENIVKKSKNKISITKVPENWSPRETSLCHAAAKQQALDKKNSVVRNPTRAKQTPARKRGRPSKSSRDQFVKKVENGSSQRCSNFKISHINEALKFTPKVDMTGSMIDLPKGVFSATIVKMEIESCDSDFKDNKIFESNFDKSEPQPSTCRVGGGVRSRGRPGKSYRKKHPLSTAKDQPISINQSPRIVQTPNILLKTPSKVPETSVKIPTIKNIFSSAIKTPKMKDLKSFAPVSKQHKVPSKHEAATPTKNCSTPSVTKSSLRSAPHSNPDKKSTNLNVSCKRRGRPPKKVHAKSGSTKAGSNIVLTGKSYTPRHRIYLNSNESESIGCEETVFVDVSAINTDNCNAKIRREVFGK